MNFPRKFEKVNILETIGDTPLIKIGDIYAKLETVNPTGSIKDRMAWYMVKEAIKRGNLKSGDKLIEVTSGNTGISFAMISAIKDYEFVAVMPESMSISRKKMMESFGAEVVLTEAEKDMKGAVEKYKELAESNEDVWLPKQFENSDNIAAHRKGLGKEIVEQTGGEIDAFVAGVGTGGTIIGVAQALKETNPETKTIAVEPESSAVLSGKEPGVHLIQGIGEGFVPKLVKRNRALIDKVVTIKSKEAINMSRRLAKDYGVLVGISSGANVLAAIKMSRRFKRVVTVLPDRGERYLEKSS